jgi:hypothetical protein
MAAQDFIGIDSTAAEPARPQDTAAQIPTALYQRAEQNSRYLMEWRGPTCVWHYPADYSGGEGVGPSFPRLAFANWAAFGPYRYYVPDVGTGAIPSVDVQIVGTVSTRRVRVAMVSNQGLGFIPNSEWLDANAQTISTGLQEILFSGVAVAPGWNDLFLLLESEADWDPLNFADDWFITGSVAADEFSSVPILVSTSGDLAIACADINKPVPFVAIRAGSALGGNDPVPDLASGPVCTIALAYCTSANPPVVPFAYLAELDGYGAIDRLGTSSPSGAKVYWSTLGMLEIYSVAVTPYANHPDKANDPTLRFLQSIGSNVANVYWKGSRLNALRQTQVGSGVPRQLGSDYNGVWKAIARSVPGYAPPGQLIRETSISTRGVQPTETDGAVSIEMSIPVISLSGVAFGRDPITFDARLELFNVTTGAVVDYIEYNNLAFLASSYYSNYGATGSISASYWLKRVAMLTESPAWRGATSVQPWSHDGATTIEDMTSTFYPLILRLPLGDGGDSPDNWKVIRQSGDLFSVRFFIKDFRQLNINFPSSFLGFGAMTARIDWGT